MRVGYLTYGLDRAPAGIGRYALGLLYALAALPHSPEIVLLTTEREDPFGLWDNFEHYPLPGCRLLPALMTGGNLLLSQAAHRYNLDLIHDPNGIAPFFGSTGAVRKIVTIHDALSYRYPEAHNTLDNWRYHWMLPRTVRRANSVITVSECSRKDLSRYLNLKEGNIQVTALGVDSHFRPVFDGQVRQRVLARYGIPSSYLLYVGGINARKNINRLLEAYSLVRKSFPDLSLVIVGKRQWKTDGIEQALERLMIKDHVHFTSYLPDEDLPAIYSAAELFVFPSLYEGFGLPPLEAMACGTPVVTSNVSSLPEVVGEAGVTVNPYDVNELSAAMERILGDQSLRKTLQHRGLQRASHFTWEQTARKTLKIYGFNQ